MAESITIKALQDASLDAKSLEEVVNGDEAKQVTTRKGETYPSVKKAIKTLFENGGLPATPFATKALMTASALVDGDYAQVTDDTANNGLYVKTAGSWVKSKYLETTMTFTDEKSESSLITVGALKEALSLGINSESMAVSFYREGYYSTTGEFRALNGILTTDKIYLHKGGTASFGLYVDPSSGGGAAMLSIFDTNGVFKSSLYKSSSHLGEFIEGTYTANEDCLIALSTFQSVIHTPFAAVDYKYVPSQKIQANIFDEVFTEAGLVEHHSYTVNGFYDDVGGYNTNAGYSSTEKIPVNKGDVVRVKAEAGNRNLALLNLYDLDDIFKANIETSASNPSGLFEFIYQVPSDGFITSSTRKDMPPPYGAHTIVYKNPRKLLLNYNDVGKSIPSYDDIANITPNTVNYGTKSYIEQGSSVLLSGASFATSHNGWFEVMATKLGVTALNKAGSSEGIGHLAVKLFTGEILTQEVLNSVSAFIIMHVWNFDVVARKDVSIDGVEYIDEQLESWSAADYEATGWTWLSTVPAKSEQTDATMSAMWDYSLKKIQAIYYEERNNPESDWYQTTTGKPFNVILTTHWHDARTKYNSSVRKLCEKWRCTLICFDENIGFTKDKLHVSGKQESILYTAGGLDRETIDGVVYGFHPERGQDTPLMKRMAAIASSVFKVI